MNDSQCMARLLASAVHDMRNVLAVIRESAGLAQDMAALAGDALPRGERLLAALSEVQNQILQGAALAEGMEFMSQAGGAENENAGPCDLARVCRVFCRMAARQARAAAIREECLKMPYLLWAEELAEPALRQAYLAAARGNFGSAV